MSEVENFCPYMCDHSSMCFWKCYNFRKFSGHVKLNLSHSPITSVSGPGITLLLVTPLRRKTPLYGTIQWVMCARSKFLQNLQMKVRLAKISTGREKFLYFRVIKIWPKHSFGTVFSENRLRVSQT